jgi:NAD(P)-dependent dehydrogenase (short-subunit alcohol dehydrogenase family)
MQGISGKVAIVTGGSAGIGRATAVAFAQQGAKVVVASRREKESQETLDLIRAAGGEGIFIQTDIAVPSDVEGLINATVEIYGRVDIACNNAGVLGPMQPLADTSDDQLDWLINVNLKGTWLCMKYQIRQMLRQGGGAIVNIASIAGLVGIAGGSAYVASKHGVVGMTKSAALDYAKAGIRINAICPAGVLTDMVGKDYLLRTPEALAAIDAMHPIGRIARPEEIGPAAVWLCSEHAGFITGVAMPVDGGWTMQ